MEYELYKEKSELDKKVMVRLLKTPTGQVQLVAVDSKGRRLRRGTLLLPTKKGRIYRCAHVSNELGFDLNSYNQIKVNN